MIVITVNSTTCAKIIQYFYSIDFFLMLSTKFEEFCRDSVIFFQCFALPHCRLFSCQNYVDRKTHCCLVEQVLCLVWGFHLEYFFPQSNKDFVDALDGDTLSLLLQFSPLPTVLLSPLSAPTPSPKLLNLSPPWSLLLPFASAPSLVRLSRSFQPIKCAQ